MKRMNVEKYSPYPAVDIPNRTWPDKPIVKAPAWCSVDLRDGNQALSVPMNVEEKMKMFDFLVATGFKEIEVGFPSAAEVEFQFVRKLIEENKIPADVTIQVLTQAREHLINKTFESLRGAKNAIVHLYNSTSRAQRDVVFRMNKDEVKNIAVQGVRQIKALKETSGIPNVRLEYSPESFTATELDYALEICHAVMDAWRPTPDEKMILNLPSTVEMSTPNVYADRIEWFCRNLRSRDSVIVSVHNHNDRGTAVASAELAVMAGAERVEGTLFGNGERCGNMDIVTMALNLFSQGVDPELDLTDIDKIKALYVELTRMEVHPRHPYAGDLVYTAFSGSHQDAINKGMRANEKSQSAKWEVPYLPIDPKDVGRNYESIIRINSQSGKGGAAYVMEKDFGIQIPKWMQPCFGREVQAAADQTGRELPSQTIYEVFVKTYIRENDWRYRLKECSMKTDDAENRPERKNCTTVKAVISFDGNELYFEECGNGPIDAFFKGMKKVVGVEFELEQYAEHSITQGSDSIAASYIQIKDKNGKGYFGVGIHEDIAIASIKAILSAINRIVSA